MYEPLLHLERASACYERVCVKVITLLNCMGCWFAF